MSCSMNSGVPPLIFLSFIILLSSFPGHVTAAEVTLRSIELHTTHELLTKPTVYFECKGENKTILPDVKKRKVVYTFKGEESWQPLTNFTSKKCKRCGLYEKDFFRHETFDEWEFCPSDFTAPDGIYTHLKDKEFNATFLCAQCPDLAADHKAPPPPPPPAPSAEKSGKKGIHFIIVILISAVVATSVTIGFIGGYKYWKKRKRQQEQARFLKLFEQHDDMEDELGLEEML